MKHFTSHNKAIGIRILQKAMEAFRLAERRVFHCLLCPHMEFSSHDQVADHVTGAHLTQEICEHIVWALQPIDGPKGRHTCDLCSCDVDSRLQGLLHLERQHRSLFGGRQTFSQLISQQDQPIYLASEGWPPSEKGARDAPSSNNFACSKCPKTFHSRSILYKHYAVAHFRQKISEMYNVRSRRRCPLCNIQFHSRSTVLIHLGSVHGAVDIFLEPQHHIAKGRCGGEKRVEDLSKPDNSGYDNLMPCFVQLDAQLVSQKGQPGDGPARLESSCVSGTVKSLSCSKCPKVFGKRCSLYLHYAKCHFKQQIFDKCGMSEPGHCPLCSKRLNSMTSVLWHFGITHGIVEACLEPEFHVAGRSLQGKDSMGELSKPSSSDSCGQSISVEEGAELDSDHHQEAMDGDVEGYSSSKTGQQQCGQPRSRGFPNSSGNTKKLPCAKCPKTFERRSDLYQHYANGHFKQQLHEKFGLGSRGRCPICNLILHRESTVRWHLGVIHGMVEEFLEPQFHVAKTRLSKSARKSIEPSRSVATGQPRPVRSWGPVRPSKFACSKCTKTLHSRHSLYKHYAVAHFKQQLLETFGSGRECLICNKRFRSKVILLCHLGITHSLVDTFLEPEFHMGKISESEKKPKLDEEREVFESGCDPVDDGFNFKYISKIEQDVSTVEQSVSLVELSVSKNMIEERVDFEHEDDYYDDYMDLLDSPESFENKDSIEVDANFACTSGIANGSRSSDKVVKDIGQDEEDSKLDCGLDNVLEDEMYSSSEDNAANVEIEKRADKMTDHQLGSEWSLQAREDITIADPDAGHTDHVGSAGDRPTSYLNNGDSGASSCQTMVITQVWSMYKPQSIPDLPAASAKTDQQQVVSLQKSLEANQNSLPDLDATTSSGSCVMNGWPVTPDSGLSESAEGTDGSSDLCRSPGSGRANTPGSADYCPSPGSGRANTSGLADSHPLPGSGRANTSGSTYCCPSPGIGRADTSRSADSHPSPESGRANISGLADCCPSPGSGRADTPRSADIHPTTGSGQSDTPESADTHPSPGSGQANTSGSADSHPSPESGRANTSGSADSYPSPGSGMADTFVSDYVSGSVGAALSAVCTVTPGSLNVTPGAADGSSTGSANSCQSPVFSIKGEPARPAAMLVEPLTAAAATPPMILSVKTLVEQCFSDSSDEEEEVSDDDNGKI